MGNKKKLKRPQKGDTAFLLGETKYRPMTFMNKVKEGEKVLGLCSWAETKMFNGKSETIIREKKFPYDSLTTEAPPILGDISLA